MVLTKSKVNEIMSVVDNVREEEVLRVHGEALAEQRTTDEDKLAEISNKILTVGKGLVLGALVHCTEQGLSIKQPSLRVYGSVDNQSDIPYIRVTLSSTPLSEFPFKETLDARLDGSFREEFITFMENTIYKFVANAVGNENVKALNSLLEEIKAEIEEDDLKVSFDLSYELNDKPIAYISNDKLVLGTTYEKMFDLAGVNSPLNSLFEDNENTAYIAEAVKMSIKEDWTSSANPLAFVRKHNQYLINLVTGDLNTRRTQRVDVLIKNSFTLTESSLKYRNKAIAHKLEKDGEETYISVFKKDGKDAEPVEILSPVNIKSLAYKG